MRNRFKYASSWTRIVVESGETEFIYQEYLGYTRTGALIFCDGDFVFLIPFYIGKAVF